MKKICVGLILLAGLFVTAAVGALADMPPNGEQVVPFEVSGAVQSPYLAPFALDGDFMTYQYGVLYTFTLKSNDWTVSPLGGGNLGLIDLGNGNAREQTAGTVSNFLFQDHGVRTMPAGKSGELRQGMESRLSSSMYADGSYQQWFLDGTPSDCRVIACPVVTSVSGRLDKVVAGFVGMYIDDYNFGTSGNIMNVYFAPLPDGAVGAPEPSAVVSLLGGLVGSGLLLRRRRN